MTATVGGWAAFTVRSVKRCSSFEKWVLCFVSPHVCSCQFCPRFISDLALCVVNLPPSALGSEKLEAEEDVTAEVTSEQEKVTPCGVRP